MRPSPPAAPVSAAAVSPAAQAGDAKGDQPEQNRDEPGSVPAQVDGIFRDQHQRPVGHGDAVEERDHQDEVEQAGGPHGDHRTGL